MTSPKPDQSPDPQNSEAPKLGKRAAAVPIDAESQATLDGAGKHARNDEGEDEEDVSSEDDESSPEKEVPGLDPNRDDPDPTVPPDPQVVGSSPQPTGPSSKPKASEAIAPVVVSVSKPGLFGSNKAIKDLETALEALRNENAKLRQALLDIEVLTPEELQEKRNAQMELLHSDAHSLEEKMRELQRRVDVLTEKERDLIGELENLRARVISSSRTAGLQALGLYRFAHPLEGSSYEKDLRELQSKMDSMVAGHEAMEYDEAYRLNGKVKDSQTFLRAAGDLLLRAYNGEADQIVRTMRPDGLAEAVDRIEKFAKHVSEVGKIADVRVSPRYHSLRLEELRMTAEYLNSLTPEELELKAATSPPGEDSSAVEDGSSPVTIETRDADDSPETGASEVNVDSASLEEGQVEHDSLESHSLQEEDFDRLVEEEAASVEEEKIFISDENLFEEILGEEGPDGAKKTSVA